MNLEDKEFSIDPGQGWTRIAILVKSRRVMGFFLIASLLSGNTSFVARSVCAATAYSIDVEEFRWTRFPLRVIVDMNQWSVPEYAFVVREALDNWMKSIWNYTNSFNDTSLPAISYVLYLSNVNATQDYDVLVTFTPNRIPPDPNTVGLTIYSWDPFTHNPVPPIITNITTFQTTASALFVGSVVMHEFGHVLGVGHAYQASTLNGPELMYYTSSKNEVVYPSTLDVYGLTRLYRGTFDQTVQLPPNIPYVMLTEGAISPPQTTIMWEDYKKYLPIAAALFLLVIAAVVLSQIGKEKKPEETTSPPPLVS